MPANITMPEKPNHPLLEDSHRTVPPAKFLSGESLEAIERRAIEASLKRNGWVQIRAARELGLTQRQIGYRIKNYGLSRYDSLP